MNENKKKKESNIVNSGIAGAATETVQRYGAANKEHLVAYSGIDNENAKYLVKSLKTISKEKINPDYQYKNIHQQAGFSAEVKEVANTNAKNIINGSTVRKIRTDDLGRVNDPIFDHVEIDKNGEIISQSGAQMKFVGASEADPKGVDAPLRALNKLQSTKFQKYLEKNAKIEVPSDYYEKMRTEADDKIAMLEVQYKHVTDQGNAELADNIKNKIIKLKKIKTNLRQSSVSSKDAVYARLHPKMSTAKSIAEISNQAGKTVAKNAAVIGASASIIRNVVSVVKGDKEPEEAVASVAKDTASSVAVGYGTGFTGSTLKGIMQNADSEGIRSLSKTNLASTVVAVAISSAKTLKSYFSGDIDGVECFEDLGEQGTGMISSGLFATIGQVAIPIPVIGGMIGGMLGYALSSASYGLLVQSLKDEKLAHEQRIEIEKACKESVKMIQTYRNEMEQYINEYLITKMDEFHNAFTNINESLQIGDIDELIAGTNSISNALGKEVQYSNCDEFNSIMKSSESFRL